MRLLSVLFLLLTPVTLLADLRIAGATSVPANRMVRLEAVGDVEGSGLFWDVFPEEKADLEECSNRLLFAAEPGVYKIKLRSVRVGKDGKTVVQTARVSVVVGETPPTPPGPPTPPTPPDPPTPPGPVSDLRVILVYESSAGMTKEQQSVFRSPKVAQYLSKKCAKTNGHPDWRRWDKDVDTQFENKDLKDLWTRYKSGSGGETLPRIVLSGNGKAMHYPLPATENETLELLKKWGGE